MPIDMFPVKLQSFGFKIFTDEVHKLAPVLQNLFGEDSAPILSNKV
ncbi:hypothetical protein MFUM_1020032 [Methylacidiphilum fumariolicum SolV]|uniref:Uncharacterized protein n=2 Tax=Candidatus Methylacidiphilum fumarolicum TaxID=591154 RepID=I0JVN9_METFB|nr:conserved protein of unknown function [Candidatus Methylacidiphilum fumarolicum]CCG91308.1 hypothetical protein MFUM_1020032 [Methylacidiphilum fumariolicum SolV]